MYVHQYQSKVLFYELLLLLALLMGSQHLDNSINFYGNFFIALFKKLLLHVHVNKNSAPMKVNLAKLISLPPFPSLPPYYNYFIFLQDISVCLAEPDLTQSSHVPLLEQLLNCISQVIQASSSIFLPPLSLNLFIVLLRLSSSFSSFSSLGPVQSAMFNLSERLSMNDIGSLYSSHALDIVTILKVTDYYHEISNTL